MNFSASTFADISHTSQPAASEEDAAKTRSLLVFHLGDRSYGLAVEHVVQIIAMVKLTPVPQADQMVEGVANIRGKIIPVLSARRHLGLPMVAPQLYTPIILLNAGDRMIGLIVDEVADVVRLPANQMTRPDSLLPQDAEDAGVLEGVVHQDENVIILINPHYLLNSAKMRAFQRDAHNLPGANAKFDEEEPLPSRPRRTRREESQPAHSAQPAAAKPAPAPAQEKKQSSGTGQGKSRKNRRNFDQTLAGEIAGLASEIPPSDGQPQVDDASDQDTLPSTDKK